MLHARRGAHDILEVGFSAARAHRVVAIDRCPVLARSLDGAIEAAWEIAEASDPPRSRSIFRLQRPTPVSILTYAALDRFRPSSSHRLRILPPGETSRVSPDMANRFCKGARRHCAWATPSSICRRPRSSKRPPRVKRCWPDSCSGVLRWLQACRGDLFTGIGPFALRLAEHMRVRAVDYDEPALAALARATAVTSGLKPVAVSGAIFSGGHSLRLS